MNRHVQNYDAGLENRALNHIVENWDTLPQRIKDLKKGSKAKKAADTLANQTVAAQPKDGVKNSDRNPKWKPNLDSTEWGIVNYIVDNNQGTAITSTCNMFFKKSNKAISLYQKYESFCGSEFGMQKTKKRDMRVSLLISSELDADGSNEICIKALKTASFRAENWRFCNLLFISTYDIFTPSLLT